MIGTQLLAADARNRALRTLYQNLGIDVLVAVVVLLLPIVTRATSLNDIDWRVLLFSVGKTIVLTLFSYVMRRYMDRNKNIPTPLPPEDPGHPNEDDEDKEQDYGNEPAVPQFRDETDDMSRTIKSPHVARRAMWDDGTPMIPGIAERG